MKEKSKMRLWVITFLLPFHGAVDSNEMEKHNLLSLTKNIYKKHLIENNLNIEVDYEFPLTISDSKCCWRLAQSPPDNVSVWVPIIFIEKESLKVNEHLSQYVPPRHSEFDKKEILKLVEAEYYWRIEKLDRKYYKEPLVTLKDGIWFVSYETGEANTTGYNIQFRLDANTLKMISFFGD